MCNPGYFTGQQVIEELSPDAVSQQIGGVQIL